MHTLLRNSYFFLVGILLITLSARAQGKYESEAPQVTLTQANIGSSNGISYAENLTQVGSTVAFTVSVPTAGMYTIAARYAAAREYVWAMSVYINSIDVAQAQFPTTASWNSWSTQQVTVALKAGTNTISYRYDADDSGWVNLDYIVVSSAVSQGFLSGSAASGELPSELAVDKFTGTASFNLSLYTVSIPGVSLPIALHYSASGVQVDNTGGEIGVNWSLQAGPSIRRQVRDLPDDIQVTASASDPALTERRYGWLRYPAGSPTVDAIPSTAPSFNATSCTANEQSVLGNLIALGSLNHSNGSYSMYDAEPDIFTYAVPGYSGKFVFDQSGAVRLIPYVPIQITPLFNTTSLTSCISVPSGELTGFTIKTPSGVLYTFDCLERISQQTQATAPFGGAKYLLRHLWDFKINRNTSGYYTGPVNIDYTTGWLATQVTTPAATTNQIAKETNTITLQYDCAAHIPSAQFEGNLFRLGNTQNAALADYALVTRVLSSPKLIAIKTATSVVTFLRELDSSDDYHISSINITAPLEQDRSIKSYVFQHLVSPSSLSGILFSRTTSNLPLYAFSYNPDPNAGIKPPISTKYGLNTDYWGFANNNRAPTGIPQLYAYPQLLSGTSLRPAAPYRLYPVPAYQNTGLVLNGADRRPANRLSVALAGTLSEVTFATGGKVLLEYEQNQFYDPVAQQSLPAGGLRIRTIKVQDPVTKVEYRRDYAYQEMGSNGSGVSSGVLLHLPHFAFVMPLTATSNWADVTVRATNELAPDPFESRHIGYKQVAEIVPGKGQVMTIFSVPAGADDATSSGDVNSGLPDWQRPVFGIARQLINGSCPSASPLQAVSELYPFAPAPNYDFCRGMPLTVQYLAEPTNGATLGTLVRQETYTYQYTNTQPSLPIVMGLRYEQLGDPSQPMYAYAKYGLLTDFLYTTRQQIITSPIAGGATNQNVISYRYNKQGWLAAKIMQGSDNVLRRTRYKYLSDYILPAAGATGELQVMSIRTKTEGIIADPVETISEIRLPGTVGPLSYTGATLQTFKAGSIMDANNNPVSTPTYPYQLRKWQPAQPVASYDSVRTINGTSLYIPALLRLSASVLDVDLNLTPLSVRTEASRQITAKHLGYAGSLPLLQIANATAAEVVFSDFESEDKPNSFKLQVATSHIPYTSEAAARTGKNGLVVNSGEAVTAYLPASTAPQYRLIFWERATTVTPSTVTITSSQGTSFTQSVTHDGSGQWKRYEILLPLVNMTNRTSYQLVLTAGGLLHLDDVLLLPADASAASTTYSLTTGKTSDTDTRGRTTYYEYGATGELSLVRDHNRAIVHYYQKILPGETVTAGLSFATTGTMREGDPIDFVATAGFSGSLQYKWDFGDNTSLSYSASKNATHTYPTLGYDHTYNVRVYVTSQGIEYVYEQPITIAMQPIVLTGCTAGVTMIDDCIQTNNGSNATIDVSCNPSAPTSSTTFKVTPDQGGTFTYQWEYMNPSSNYGAWTSIPGNSNDPSALTVSKNSLNSYRCRVANTHQEVVSELFYIMHYKSNLNCP